MVADSYDYKNFLEHMKSYGVPRNILAHESCNLYKCFDALENKNLLSAGKYEALKEIASNSGNTMLLQSIQEAEIEIGKIKDSGILLL